MTADERTTETPSDPTPTQQERRQGAKFNTAEGIRLAKDKTAYTSTIALALFRACREIDRLRAEKPPTQERSQGLTVSGTEYARDANDGEWGRVAIGDDELWEITDEHADCLDEIERLRREISAPVVPCPHGWEDGEGLPMACPDCLRREVRQLRAELVTWHRNPLEAQVPKGGER